MAPLSRLLLFAAPLFVFLVGLLAHFRFGTLERLPLPDYFGAAPSELSTHYEDDKMGGGDGYRSVAYFVNVSVFLSFESVFGMLFLG